MSEPKKKDKFEIHFLIIPIQDMLEKIKFKKIKIKQSNKAKYNFYFSFEDNNRELIDIRETKEHKEEIIKNNPEAFNYSKYLNAWKFIEKRL